MEEGNIQESKNHSEKAWHMILSIGTAAILLEESQAKKIADNNKGNKERAVWYLRGQCYF